MFDFLEILQLETSTVCNMHCHYCDYHQNPSSNYSHQMPLELVEKIMRQFEGHRLMWIQPWLAGEPLLETRMPEIVRIIRKYSDAPLVFFTNATVYENREILMLADRVEVSVSAATRETYAKVHGRDLLDRVIKTVEWLESQPSHPEIRLRMVVTSLNYHEVAAWRKQWSRFRQFQNIATSLLIRGWNPELGIDGEIEQIQRGEYMKGAPCLFWNLCAINVFGDMYQCCKAICTVWGNLNTSTLEELWGKRLANKRDTPDCRVCPVRIPLPK